MISFISRRNFSFWVTRFRPLYSMSLKVIWFIRSTPWFYWFCDTFIIPRMGLNDYLKCRLNQCFLRERTTQALPKEDIDQGASHRRPREKEANPSYLSKITKSRNNWEEEQRKRGDWNQDNHSPETNPKEIICTATVYVPSRYIHKYLHEWCLQGRLHSSRTWRLRSN